MHILFIITFFTLLLGIYLKIQEYFDSVTRFMLNVDYL